MATFTSLPAEMRRKIFKIKNDTFWAMRLKVIREALPRFKHYRNRGTDTGVYRAQNMKTKYRFERTYTPNSIVDKVYKRSLHGTIELIYVRHMNGVYPSLRSSPRTWAPVSFDSMGGLLSRPHCVFHGTYFHYLPGYMAPRQRNPRRSGHLFRVMAPSLTEPQAVIAENAFPYTTQARTSNGAWKAAKHVRCACDPARAAYLD